MLANAIKKGFAEKTGREIHFGRFIHRVRLALQPKRGEWSKPFRGPDRVPFSKKMGENWNRIGEVWGGVNAKHVAHLGFTFRVLLALSALGTALLEELIQAGAIYSGLSEAKAREMIAKYRPDLIRPPRPLDTLRILARIREQLEEIVTDGTYDDPVLAEAQLEKIEQQVAAAKALCLKAEEQRSTSTAEIIPAICTPHDL